MRKRGRVRMRSRAVLFTMLALGWTCGPASSRSLQLQGSAGYLSEWEISATVSDREAGGDGSLAGPVTLKHVGICAVKDPAEKSGEMNMKVSGWGPFAVVEITMRFAGMQCTYKGGFADRLRGAMDCSDAKGVPLDLSVR